MHKNCSCNCHDSSASKERKYILVKPLHLRDVSLPVGTIIHGPINPFWFEDNIVKVYNGNKKPLSLDDIIRSNEGSDIRIADNDNDISEVNIPNEDDLCNCENNEITVNSYNNCKCNCKKCNCNKCNCNRSSGSCCKCCKCCKVRNLDDQNMIIFDVGEPSRIALEEKAMYETIKEVRERNENKVIKRRSYP